MIILKSLIKSIKQVYLKTIKKQGNDFLKSSKEKEEFLKRIKDKYKF